MTSIAEQKAYRQGFYNPLVLATNKNERNRARALKAWETIRKRNKSTATSTATSTQLSSLIVRLVNLKKEIDSIIEALK